MYSLTYFLIVFKILPKHCPKNVFEILYLIPSLRKVRGILQNTFKFWNKSCYLLRNFVVHNSVRCRMTLIDRLIKPNFIDNRFYGVYNLNIKHFDSRIAITYIRVKREYSKVDVLIIPMFVKDRIFKSYA